MKSRHLALTLSIILALTLPIAAEEDPDIRSIEVTGLGIVTQTPDVAKVVFVVETHHKEAKDASRSNAALTSKVIKSLSKLPSDDVKTTNYRVSPRYKDRSRGDRDLQPIGFVVTNTIEVTLRDLKSVGSIIDKTVAAGATRVDQIRFELSDPGAARKRALTLAMEHAREEAQTLMDASSNKLGRVLRARTGGGHYAPRAERAMMSMGKMDTPIAPGTLDTRAQVTVTFEIL